jgi:hypothetical protein
MEARKYFGGSIQFEVEALDKADALKVGIKTKEYQNRSHDIMPGSLRCVKKCKPIKHK